MVEISISRIVADFIILLCCAIPLLIFHEWVKPYRRGFYCDDESIRYPFRQSTISRQMLVVVGLIIPTLLIFCTEVFRATAWERKCKHHFQSYKCRNIAVHRLIVRLYVFLGYFLLGVVFNQLMVDIAKYTIGRHRPHFIDVCKPKGFETCPINQHQYIVDFECTGTDKNLVHESMLSFYSGHSAFSFYAAWFTALYLQARLYRPLFSRLLLPVIQFALFGAAAYVAYTRVSDYKHHWSDVLVGAIMGSAIGIIVAVFIAEVFSRREIPICDHDGRAEFGLIRLEKAPIADVESGLRSSDGTGTQINHPTSHTVTITQELSPNLNTIDNQQPMSQQRLRMEINPRHAYMDNRLGRTAY
uniref:Phosphatidic acid phosphatase type 2/haloperoxidase domain-containing protein n=1 Tax=Parascaris univalens TaxID=6257 RepID=A0A914ZRD1_PARUN